MSEDNKFIIKPSEVEDIMYLKDNLRKDDIEEVTALGSTPLTSLCEGYIFSQECYTCFVGTKPIGMFGVGYIDGTQGSIWFLGTDETNNYVKEWIINGRQYINHFLNIYPILTNIVAVNNTAHVRWLKRLGAVFSTPFEKNNQLFQDFYFLQSASKPVEKTTNLEVGHKKERKK